MILGRDLLDLIGVNIEFKAHVVSWIGRDIPMKSTLNMKVNPSAQIENLHNHFLCKEAKTYGIIAKLYANNVVIMDQKSIKLQPWNS